jgi:hypothetical protein
MLPAMPFARIGTLDRLTLRRQPATTLQELANEVCDRLGIPLETLRSVSQARALSQARAHIAARAIDCHVATLSDVARYLNHSASSLSRA